MKLFISLLISIVSVVTFNGKLYADDLLFEINSLMRMVNYKEEQVVVRYTSIDKPSKQTDIKNIIKKAANEHNINPLLIESIIKVESNFNPCAVSPKGAMGLMQLMPGTAREIGVTRPFDPYQNVMGGTYYYRLMLDRFGDHKKALYAYNCGPLCVENENIPRESLDYAKSVIRTYSELKKKGEINE